MNSNRIKDIRRTLLQQFNEQNDGTKTEWLEKYNYLLTEEQFDVIIDMATELITLKKIIGE